MPFRIRWMPILCPIGAYGDSEGCPMAPWKRIPPNSIRALYGCREMWQIDFWHTNGRAPLQGAMIEGRLFPRVNPTRVHPSLSPLSPAGTEK